MEYKEFVKELGKLGKRPDADAKTVARYSYDQFTSDFPLIETEFGTQSVAALSKFIREHNPDFPIAPHKKIVSNIVQFSKSNSIPEICGTDLTRSLVYLACDWILDPSARPSNDLMCTKHEHSETAKMQAEPDTDNAVCNDDDDEFLPFDEEDNAIFDTSYGDVFECEDGDDRIETIDDFICFTLTEASSLDSLFNEKAQDMDRESKDFNDMMKRITYLMSKISESAQDSDLHKYSCVMRPLVHLVCNGTKYIKAWEKVLGDMLEGFMSKAPFYAMLALSKISRQPTSSTFVSGYLKYVHERLCHYEEMPSEELEHIGEFITNYSEIGGAPSLFKSQIITAAFSALDALKGQPVALMKAAVRACSYCFQAFAERYEKVGTGLPTDDKHVCLAWEVMCSCHKKGGFPGNESVVGKLRELSDISGPHWTDFEMSVEYLHRMSSYWGGNFALPRKLLVFLDDFLVNKCVVTINSSTSTNSGTGINGNVSGSRGVAGGDLLFIDDEDDILNNLMKVDVPSGSGRLDVERENEFISRITDDAAKRSSHLAEIKKLLTAILHKTKSD